MRHEQALAAALRQSKTMSVGATPLAAPMGGFAGVWRNQYGSTMDLTVNGSSISGTYVSPVSGTGNTVTGSLVGYIADDVIAFVVKWPTSPESFTTWVGQVVDVGGFESIKTLWHLVRNIPDSNEPTGLWLSVLTGSDEFRR